MVFGLFSKLVGLFSKQNKLLKVIENGEVDAVSSLLKGFDKINETFSKPDNKDVEKWTYLLHSCRYGNADIVQALLENGADLNDQDSDGKPPLYWASCNDDDEAARICNLLIERGVDINHQATDGRVALIGATINSNNKTLEMLLGAGADPNFQMEDGASALHVAAGKSAEAVRVLLEHNVEPNIENIDKQTPIFYAAAIDDMEIINALVEAGADINHEIETPDGEKLYPLDVAIGEDNQAVAMYLFSKGAKHNPDLSDIEVMVHANEEQASFHGELGAEGKYHYELHMKDLNRKQIKHMKSEFEEYTWDMGFAVTDFEYKQDGDLFKIVFDSKKYFDADDDDWDDKDLAQNIVTRILGKEQFICSTLWATDYDFEEKDIVFIDDKKNEWAVEIGKHGGLSKILRDREVALEAVKEDGLALEHADDSLKADREVVLEAVKEDGRALEYADDNLKADREVVLEAVKCYGGALEYADDSLKTDREVVLEAVKSSGGALEYADDSLKADREVVLEAVKQSGWDLQYADDSLKADREFVLEAVKEDGDALYSAAEELQEDPELKKIAEG